MADSKRPARFPRKDYSQLHTFGLDSKRIKTMATNESDDSGSSSNEFMAEPYDNEPSDNEAFEGQPDSQNPSSSFDLG